MNWKREYNNKLLSAKEAASKIKSGDTVVFGLAAGVPTAVTEAMIENKEQYENVEIVHLLSLGNASYTHPGMEKHFHHTSIFLGANTRKAVNEGRADFIPCFFYEVPRLFSEGHIRADVAVVHISCPNKHGYCSFGVSVDYIKPVAENASMVIAEVNDKMPVTYGNSFIHISQIDWIVETSVPIVEVQPSPITEVEQSIGEYCATLIDDGSTLQLGIGGIPDAVLMFLTKKKDLGIHSEMISDGVIELVEMGVINNKRKSIHQGKMVATFLMGTKRLYDFVDHNPLVEMYPVNYVNNPIVIAKNNKMVSINSALQIDLMGQVGAETIGGKQFTGVGGQVDFIRGAANSPGGKSIIALPSTANNGKISRIVPLLDEGSVVTTSRCDVDYVVTEFGIAHLRGRTLKERGKALIKIAHPDFQPFLVEEWEKRFCCNFSI